MAETFRPPQGVREEANRALEWIADGKAGPGFTDTGRARAVQLANGEPVSAETIMRMYSFFARHEVDKKATGFNAGEDGFPTPGRVAWSAWGGDAGFTWSRSIREKLAARSALIIGETMEKRSETIPDLVEELQELLGDTFAMYFLAHGAHWNVTGSDFAEYHKLFGKIYEDVWGSVDDIAENLRKLGSKAPASLAEVVPLADPKLLVGTASQITSVLTILLRDANDLILEQLNEVFACATMTNQQGIANFIAGRIDQHQLWKWQLSASINEEVIAEIPVVDDYTDNEETEVQAEVVVETNSSDVEVETETVETESDEDRASAARIGEGSFVSWNSSGGRSRGKVEKVVTKGPATSSDGFVIEAAPDYPVFLIRIYEAKGNGWIPTDKTVVHRSDLLTVITPLPSPRSEDNMDMEQRKSRMASAERVTMDCEVRSLSTDSTSLRIGGYAAQFNKEATGLSFREVIAPGAFKRTLDSAEPVFLLINHDTDNLPLASTQSGTMSLREDETGLWMEADLDPNNPRAQELASAVSRGDVNKMSFAFTVAPGGDTREDGLRTLQDLNLFEVSVVTWPAYDSTTVGMRTASAEDAEQEALELRKRMLELKQKFSNNRNR